MSQRPRPRARRPSERVRQPTEVRRRLIVDAARDLIAEQGLATTTLREIARASGVSVGTVTYHFAGLDDVLADVLRSEIESFYVPLAQAARDAESGAEALGIHIDRFFGTEPREVQHARLWLDFFSLAVRDSTHARWQMDAYATWRADIAAALERGIEDGSFEMSDLETMTTDFIIAFDGLTMQAYARNSPLGPLGAREYLHDWVRRHFVSPATGNDQP
ncbi:TetR/AcrR family transcriptional regulator [Nocardioides sp.]|uniref:TetR/AcrR family transcriptional regulator n=1 Tax=Nocardioides sp. TaxID=35761 RepID=UPI0039E6DB03